MRAIKAGVVWGVAMGLLCFAQQGAAKESVWRYVDEKTGKVTYSNVQVKGQKGEKIDILQYPEIQIPVAPIPVKVNPPKGIEGSQEGFAPSLPRRMTDKPAVPPSTLPPLPGLTAPGAIPAPRAAMESEIPSEQGKAPEQGQATSGASLGSAAKEERAQGTGFGADPFKQQ